VDAEVYEVQVSGQVSVDIALKILQEARVSKDMIGAVIDNLREQGIIEKTAMQKAHNIYKELAVRLKDDDDTMKLVNALRDAFLDHRAETD
jgi:hypothetical protein